MCRRCLALFLSLFSFLIFTPIVVAENQDGSAWKALVSRDPAVVDKPEVSWQERLALDVLTPEQARLYYAGADFNELVLRDGRTLSEYMEQRLNPPGSLYVPLAIGCSLFEDEFAGGGESHYLFARGQDLSMQGGSRTGCGIAEEAVALILRIEVEAAAEEDWQIKAWPSDLPEPYEAVVSNRSNLSESWNTALVVSLCTESSCSTGDFQIKSSVPSLVRGHVKGYFRPIAVSDQAATGLPGGGVSYLLESASNNLMGIGAGAGILAGGTGLQNTFLGAFSGQSTSGGNYNTAVGALSLNKNVSGDGNTAVGRLSLYNNTSGSHNTGVGEDTLWKNTDGYENTAVGDNALTSNEGGYKNTAVGQQALALNVGGHDNAALGKDAGLSNTQGNYNTFFGSSAGRRNTTGNNNAFFGNYAGIWNSTASYNSFFGGTAGYLNKTGTRNTFAGYGAGYWNDASDNSFFGHRAGHNNKTGVGNAFFGNEAGFSNLGTDSVCTAGHCGGYNAFFGFSAGYANTTGGQNAFFGSRAGYSNNTGYYNSYVGAGSGYENTVGHHNSFVGFEAGKHNETGSYNAFFGTYSGDSNVGTDSVCTDPNRCGNGNSFFGSGSGGEIISGSDNSFFGRGAGDANQRGSFNSLFGAYTSLNQELGDNNTLIGAWSQGKDGIENGTAIGYRAVVASSNSLVLGSIAGANEATDNVNVGIGTPVPSAPLHVKRADETSKILVEETNGTPKARALFELVNNGGPRFQMTDTDSGRRWEFTSLARFNINFLGRAGQEFQVDTQGNGYFAGNVTANGVVYTSDREQKTDFTSVNQSEILEKVASLPVTMWRFKDEEAGIRHAGPTAQDFYAAFGLGADDKHINASDISGVALAAIQGLYQVLQEKEDEIQAVKAELNRKDAQMKGLVAEVAELKKLRGEMAQIRALVANSAENAQLRIAD